MIKKSFSFGWIVGLVFLSLIAATAALPVEFHVTDAAGLQGAMDTAGGNGADDAIYLAAGTYPGSFLILYGNTLVGGGLGYDLYVQQTSPGAATANAFSFDIYDVKGDASLYHPTNVINSDPLFVDVEHRGL